MPRVWMDSGIDLTPAVAATAIVVTLNQLAELESRFTQMTLLRTIVGLDVARLTHDSGEGSELVSLGIGIVSSEAFVAGGTSLPQPQNNTEFPVRGWIWRARYRVYGFAADQPAVFNRRVDLDLRSMRKLENGVPYFTAQVQAVEGSNSVAQVSGLIRQLWLVS